MICDVIPDRWNRNFFWKQQILGVLFLKRGMRMVTAEKSEAAAGIPGARASYQLFMKFLSQPQ